MNFECVQCLLERMHYLEEIQSNYCRIQKMIYNNDYTAYSNHDVEKILRKIYQIRKKIRKLFKHQIYPQSSQQINYKHSAKYQQQSQSNAQYINKKQYKNLKNQIIQCQKEIYKSKIENQELKNKLNYYQNSKNQRKIGKFTQLRFSKNRDILEQNLQGKNSPSKQKVHKEQKKKKLYTQNKNTHQKRDQIHLISKIQRASEQQFDDSKNLTERLSKLIFELENSENKEQQKFIRFQLLKLVQKIKNNENQL